MGDITLNPNIASNTSNPASAVDNASTNATLSSIAPATSTSSSSTTPSADAANAWASGMSSAVSMPGLSNLSGANLSNVTPQTGVSLSGLSALAPAAPAAPAAPPKPTLPANPTSADLKAAGYSLQSMDDGGDYGGPDVWVGPGGTFDQYTIQQNDNAAQAAADAAAQKAGNFTYAQVIDPDTGDATIDRSIKIPNAPSNYTSNLSSYTPANGGYNVVQDVNRLSGNQLSTIYDAINSGSYALSGNTLYTGSGNQYTINPTSTNGVGYIRVGAGSDTGFAIPIAYDSQSGKAAMPLDLVTQGTQYIPGKGGGVFGGVLNSLAPVLSLASLAIPELAPFAAGLNTAEAVNSGNVLGALASATGIPGVSDAVGSALGTTGSTVTNALKTANTANNLVNAVNSGNVTGALSAGASLTGVGSTPVSGDLPGSGVTVSDALKVANLANAVASGNQNAIINAATQVGTSPTIQNAVNPAEGMGQIGTASGTVSPASLNYPTDSTKTQTGALPTTDQTASADNTQTAGALPTSTNTTTASSSGFNTLDPSQIASVLNTGAVTAGQGTQTASAGSNLPQTSPPTGTTSATYPPDIGATWDAASGRWIDPSGNGYWTMNGSGGYTYTDYSPTTSQGDGTSVGNGTGTSGTGQGATENAPNTTSNVVDTSGALPSQPVDTNQISNTSPLQTVNASATDTTGVQTGALPTTQTSANQSTQTDNQSIAQGTDVTQTTGALPSTPTLTTSDVQNIVDNALANNPSLTTDQVQNIVNTAIQNNPTLTADQVNSIVNTAVSNAVGGLPTTADVQNAIQSATSGLSQGLANTNQNVANLSAQDQANYNQLSAEQQAQAQALVAQGNSLSDAINQVSQQNQSGLSALSNQFTNQLAQSDANTQAQFNQLSSEQQKTAQDLVNQGQSLQDAINQASQQQSQALQSGLSSLSQNFQNQLAQSDANTQAGFANLTAAQQAEAQARVAQGQDLQTAISDVQSGLTQQIQSGLSGLSTDFQNKLAQSDANTQSNFDKLNADQQAQAQALAEQGTSLTDAISQVAQQNQAGLSALGSTVATNQAQTQAQLANMSAQEQSDVANLTQQGVSLQDAINQVSAQTQSGLSALGSTVASNQASTESQLSGMSAQEQSDVKALQSQGVSLQDAINQVSAQTQSGLSALGSTVASNEAQTQQSLDELSQNFQNQLASSSQETQDQFNSLNSSQQALAATLASSTGDLQSAIDQVSQQSQEGIAGVGQQVSDLGGQLQSFQSITDQRIQDLMDQGMSQQDAIDTVNQEISAMGTDLQSQIASSDQENQSALSNLASSTNANISNLASSTQSGINSLANQISSQNAQNQAKQALSDASKFIDVKNPWLTVGKSQEQGIQENQLQQIYNSLDPNLKQALASKGIAPQTAASGGSIYGIEPELYKVMMSRMGYDDGGEVMTQTGNMFSDMAKTAKSMEPKFVRSDPHFLRPQNKNQSMQLGALTQLKQAPRLGGLAHGGLPSKYEENAPKGHNPEFITGITGYYAGGRGTGQSDDIPAMLHEGDHVADADVVAALGDGSSKAGKQVLDNFRQSIPHNDQSKGKPVPAMIADGEYVMPEAFVTALGQGDNKRGAQLLDIMREELRKHKRSAPDSKIPPKALSPLEYIHRGMKKSGAKK